MDAGGGDRRAIQFVQIGQQLAQYFEIASTMDIRPIRLKDLKNALDASRVESTEESLELRCLMSKEAINCTKAAINYPRDKLILLNAKEWDSILSGSERAVLVLHEYLGILRIDDKNYQYSKRIIQNRELRFAFNVSDAASSLNGKNIPFPIKCRIYEGKNMIKELQPIGNTGPNDMPMSSYGLVTDAEVTVAKGDVHVRVTNNSSDLDAEPTIGRRFDPTFRVQIALGRQIGQINPESLLAQADVKASPDVETIVTAPQMGVAVYCKRMTKDDPTWTRRY